jgi:hypothetical protein
MKHQADEHHSQRPFEVGDLVYFKAQSGSNQKMSFGLFGPYRVLKTSIQIHYMVHVSQQHHKKTR